MRIDQSARRVFRSFLRSQSAQIALHERYLERQRPWQQHWLQWTGNRLTGKYLPPADRATSPSHH